MQQQVAAKKADVLQEEIGSLTPWLLALKHYFAAAKVKPNGLRYSKSRLLDCIITKTESRRSYEHLCKNKILALPRKSTPKCYISIYCILSGFNKKTLIKTEIWNSGAWHQQEPRGIAHWRAQAFWEFVLEEHWCNWRLQFVNLGPFTTQKDKSTPSDHGMVVFYVPF